LCDKGKRSNIGEKGKEWGRWSCLSKIWGVVVPGTRIYAGVGGRYWLGTRDADYSVQERKCFNKKGKMCASQKPRGGRKSCKLNKGGKSKGKNLVARVAAVNKKLTLGEKNANWERQRQRRNYFLFHAPKYLREVGRAEQQGSGRG